MIDLVLDDLRGETSECGMALAELAIRIRDLNALEANRAALAFERQAAFGGVVGAVFRSDRRVEHYEDATAEILVHECNDAPHFMITWTPNHVSSSSQPMLDGMQQYFNGSIDMDTFIDEMKALPTE